MKKTVCVLLGGLAVVATAASPLVAHHAFGGEFDPNRPILLRGAVTKVEWVNPHAWIHLAATEVTVAGEKKNLKLSAFVQGVVTSPLFTMGKVTDQSTTVAAGQ